MAVGIAFGADVVVEEASSSPAMKVVSRPPIQDPNLSNPGLAGVFRADNPLAGSVDGEPVSRSCRSSSDEMWCESRRGGPVLASLDACSTA